MSVSDFDSRQIRREVGRMQIIGYYVHGSKEYVAFKEDGKDEEYPNRFKITDGFHDKSVNEKNVGKYKGYRWTSKKEIDLEKIISRMRGTRPWHPLLQLLKKEASA